jgi:serine/threonine protein kinase
VEADLSDEQTPLNVTVDEARIYGPGDFIGGNYEVLRVFEGGLGRVYVVTKDDERFVLKTIKVAKDGHSRKMFFDEAKTWISLGRHQNIIPAFWVDEIAGLLAIAAEFVEPDELGRTSLRDYLGFGPRSLTQVFRWAAEFCYGLEHAVSKGLAAHRDIKPENLLVGAQGGLQITDFGIATTRPLGTRDSNFEAQMGAMVPEGISGTPPYMAPEQWLGRPQDIRTDLYAFGIVLHELCLGGMPWIASNLRQLYEAHLSHLPVVRDHPLKDVILTCLSKDSAQRYASPRALLDAISNVATQHRIPFPPRPPPLDQRCEELRARSSLGVVGNRQDAIQAARDLVSEWPDDAGGWTQLSRLFAEDGDLKQAEAAVRYSLRLDPSRSAPWNNLGLICAGQGRYDESTEAYKRAIDADPENTGAMANIAQPLRHLHAQGAALQYLRRATELAPDK